MSTYKRFVFRYNRVLSSLLLALFWVVGLLVGYYIATRASVSVLMCTIALERVSIVGLVFAIIFPLVISATAIWLSAPLLIFPIAFLKALLFGFCASALALVYPDAGWLARWLYIYSDSFMVIILLWFWKQNIPRKTDTFKTDFSISLFVASLLVCIDYFIVSPFSVTLFNYS